MGGYWNLKEEALDRTVWGTGFGRILAINLVNPLNTELNPICHLLALLGAHHIFHVSGLRVNAQNFVL